MKIKLKVSFLILVATSSYCADKSDLSTPLVGNGSGNGLLRFVAGLRAGCSFKTDGRYMGRLLGCGLRDAGPNVFSPHPDRCNWDSGFAVLSDCPIDGK